MTEREERAEGDPDRMQDVSHTPPHGDGANRVWDGTRVYEEGADEAVSPRDRDDRVASGDDDRVAPRDDDRPAPREGDDE